MATTSLRRFAPVIAAIMAVTTCTAPTTSSPATGTASAAVAVPVGGNVTVRLISDWSPPGPGLTTNDSASQIENAMYDRLIAINDDGKVVPYVASSFTTTPTSVTFTIRTDVTCSDGTKVTPAVVVDSLKRLVSPELKSPWGGAQTFGVAPPYTITSDATTVTFGVSAPHGELIYGFNSVHTGIVCPAGLKATEADFAAHSYGSGPFVMGTIKPQESIVVTRRADWKWGPNGTTANDPGFPDTLTFRVVADDTTAANLLVTGGLDLASVVGPDVKRLRANADLNEIAQVSKSANPMVFNVAASHPTFDKAVRNAISTAVDPKSYGDAAYDGDYEVAGTVGWYGKGMRCFDPQAAALLPTGLGDVNKAKSILLAAGYTMNSSGKLEKGGKPLTIELIATSSTGNGPEYVAEQLNKVGITTVLKKTDDALHRINLFDGKFDIAFRGDSAVTGPASNGGVSYLFQPQAHPPTALGWNYMDDPANAAEYAKLQDLYAKARADTTCTGWWNWSHEWLSQNFLMPLVFAKYSQFGRGAGYQKDYWNQISIRRLR